MKRETVEEFLARGGEITKVPEYQPEEPKKKEVTCRSTSKMPHKPMHITEGAVYWGESKESKKEPKKFTGNIDDLPESLVISFREKGKLP